MAVITTADVQAWLQKSKYPLAFGTSGDTFDAELEEAARTAVFGKLSLKGRYDVSGWADEGATPQPVRSVIAMLVAAWTYSRAVSEDENSEGTSYSDKLERRAWQIIESILADELDIGQLPDDGKAIARSIIFYPTDDQDDTDEGRMFSVGAEF